MLSGFRIGAGAGRCPAFAGLMGSGTGVGSRTELLCSVIMGPK